MMGKLSLFDISLNNPEAVYCAGQTVYGTLNVNLQAALKLEAIRVVIKGKAFVHWTEQSMRGPGEIRFREVRHYSSTEDYFDYSMTLLKVEGKKSKKFVLPAGNYSYPFQFQLPPNLPSSFEGYYGHVRYWVRGTIDKPWNFDHMTKKPFTVVSALDLNSLPEANKSVQEGAHKHLCCLCCTSGPVSAFLSLEKRGFVPGEPISINAEVENLTGRKMGNSSVELKMTTVFHTNHKTRSISTQLMKLKHGSIGRGGTDTWHEEPLFVPAIPPSYLLGCSLIDIQYTLELRVDPVGPAFDLSVPVEVIIGTVPLHSSIQKYIRNHPPIASPQGASPGNPPPNSFSSLLPMTYEESIFGQVFVKDEEDAEYTRGQLHFVPKYTLYIWNG